MFNPYHNFYQSYYFYEMLMNPTNFNYDPFVGQVKISPNIILAENQTKLQHRNSSDQKCQETRINSCPAPLPEKKQKIDLIKKIKIKVKIEKQASPKKHKKVAKPQKKTDLVQRQGRNSHSNILRKFFKLLSVKNQFKSAVGRIISKYGFSVGNEQFFELVKARNIDHRNYIRVRQIQWLFSEKSNEINKITRILFENYLRNYYVEHLLSSKKTDNKSIVFHLRGRRSLKEEIIGEKYPENFEMDRIQVEEN